MKNQLPQSKEHEKTLGLFDLAILGIGAIIGTGDPGPHRNRGGGGFRTRDCLFLLNCRPGQWIDRPLLFRADNQPAQLRECLFLRLGGNRKVRCFLGRVDSNRGLRYDDCHRGQRLDRLRPIFS